MVKSILSERQNILLKLLFKIPTIQRHFYLTGGTALAEFYLHHRYSEDLDFFSPNEVDPLSVQITLKKISKKTGIKSIDYQQSFNRNLYFLHFTDEIIKTEFTYFPFTSIETPKKIGDLVIDSLIDIAVNKTFTIYQTPKSRHFIDLYLIIKSEGMSFADLRKKARAKFDTNIDPLQMTQQLLEVANQKDYPRLVINHKPEIWQKFWLNEAEKLKKEALI